MQGSLVELAKDYIHRKNSLSLSQQLAAANGSMAGGGVVCPVPLSALRFGLAWAHSVLCRLSQPLGVLICSCPAVASRWLPFSHPLLLASALLITSDMSSEPLENSSLLSSSPGPAMSLWVNHCLLQIEASRTRGRCLDKSVGVSLMLCPT